MGVENPQYFEFMESVQKFEEGNAETIDENNQYYKALTELNNCDYEIRGKRLAQLLEVNGVREELRVLTINDLIEHPVQGKSIISEKGKDYLKIVTSK